MNELITGIDPTANNQELSFNSNTFEINIEETKNDLNSGLYGLNERSKNEKLSLDQRGLLKEMLSTQQFSLKELQLKFNISYSVLNRIKRCPFSELNKQNSRKVTKISNWQRQVIINAIKEHLKTKKHTLNAKEITKYLNNSLNLAYSASFIRTIMKSQMRLSYKRVKSRPNGVYLNRLNNIRSWFAIKFSRLIDRDTLLVNIDESYINRKVKSNYSWRFKGCPVEVNNSAISDSENLIMGICSNGSWITMILNETTDAAWFI